MKISEYVNYSEVVKSNTAKRLDIDNTPNQEQLDNLMFICMTIFDPLRKYFGKPIGLSSAFRHPLLNAAINGSKTSQHVKGEALDIDADIYGGMTNTQIGYWIRANCDFDQLIFEHWNEEKNDFSWIHVSARVDGLNRGQILEMYKDENGKSKYKKL